MNRLSLQKRAQILSCLVEGNSIRSTVRITGAAKNTVSKLLQDIGEACLDYQDKHLRDLPCKRLQTDEIWSFCYAKKKNVPKDKQGVFGYGDVWTWTAICADTKLVPCWEIGPRDAETAVHFIANLKARLKNRVQLTSDGLRIYIDAVENAFGADIDYAMLVKMYGEPARSPERKYSPSEFVCAEQRIIQGSPNQKHISTSYVERQNLTMRMSMRRFTRLTNAFSKKITQLANAVSLHFMYYNFVRPHRSLRTKMNNRITPAMAAGIASRPWRIEDIIRLLDSN